MNGFFYMGKRRLYHVVMTSLLQLSCKRNFILKRLISHEILKIYFMPLLMMSKKQTLKDI